MNIILLNIHTPPLIENVQALRLKTVARAFYIHGGISREGAPEQTRTHTKEGGQGNNTTEAVFIYTYRHTQHTTHNPRTLEAEHDLRGEQREQLPRSSEKQSHFYEAEKIGGGYFWRGGTPAGAAADTGSRAGSSKLPS